MKKSHSISVSHHFYRAFQALVLLVFLNVSGSAQLLSWGPDFITDANAGDVTITMDANFGNKGLLGYNADDVYVHIGLITSESTGAANWLYTKTTWGTTPAAYKATSAGTNKWQFTISNLRQYFGVVPGEQVLKIAILFRNGAGNIKQANADGSDMYIPVIQPGQHAIRIRQPFFQPTFQPIPEPANWTVGSNLALNAVSSLAGDMKWEHNGAVLTTQSGTTVQTNYTVTATGTHQFLATSISGGSTVSTGYDFYIPVPVEVADVPAGMRDGINYNPSGTEATLVLFAPQKSSVQVIGDFSDWQPQAAYQMKRSPDGNRYWLSISGLMPGREYGYQYLIDGSLKVADAYSEKVLDPWNDAYINQAPYLNKYPNLKPYPTGKTTGIVSVLQPGKAAYNWQVTSFSRPDKNNLIIYELLLRDFMGRSDWQTLQDTLNYLLRLGVNAIQLMPFTEFEGNNSWGYNPAFMFAADKFYGPENTLKRFIDVCHANGIAVILDLVLNHQFGSSPLVQMYWDAANSKPAGSNPWFNPDAKHPFNVGYDMNHASAATKAFTYRVMEHWLQQFRIDGFRWDLSKGFTQTTSNGDDQFRLYDASRINIWKDYYAKSQVYSSGAYMILEHFAEDREEAELAQNGMMLWGNQNHAFNQNSMGYSDQSDLSRLYAKTRWTAYGAGNLQNLVGYAESHDEERLAYKNRKFGNSTNVQHDAKQPAVYSNRMQTVAAFLLSAPGPKMLWQFGELAYDSSINMCEDLKTYEDGRCRTAPKPPAWNMPGGNYNNNIYRIPLRNMYSKLIALRTKNPAYVSTWTSTDHSFSLGNTYFKWQWLRGPNLSVVTAGNFNVSSMAGNVEFPATGTWYLYAGNWEHTTAGTVNPNMSYDASTGQVRIQVNSLSQSLNLPPGSFALFTDRLPELPVNREYVFIGNGSWQLAANWVNGQVPPGHLPAGSKITINPLEGGEAILDVNQTIGNGATLIVLSGKTLRLTSGNLIRN